MDKTENILTILTLGQQFLFAPFTFCCVCSDVYIPYKWLLDPSRCCKNKQECSGAGNRGEKLLIQHFVWCWSETREMHICTMYQLEVTREFTSCAVWTMSLQPFVCNTRSLQLSALQTFKPPQLIQRAAVVDEAFLVLINHIEQMVKRGNGRKMRHDINHFHTNYVPPQYKDLSY